YVRAGRTRLLSRFAPSRARIALVRGPHYGNSVVEETPKRAHRGLGLHVVPRNSEPLGPDGRRPPMCDERRTIPTLSSESTNTVIVVSQRIEERFGTQLQLLREHRTRPLELEAGDLVRQQRHLSMRHAVRRDLAQARVHHLADLLPIEGAPREVLVDRLSRDA